MSKKVVLMDLDGVVVDLDTPWFDAYNKLYDDTLTPEDIKGWDIHKFTKPECGIRIYEILDQEGFFLSTRPYAGAVEGLTRIAKVADLVVLTSALDKPNAAREKLIWVREHLPMVRRGNIIITPRKDLVYGDIMVDDSPNNLKKTRAIHKIVVDHPYNRRVRDAERVHNWTELTEAVMRYVEE